MGEREVARKEKESPEETVSRYEAVDTNALPELIHYFSNAQRAESVKDVVRAIRDCKSITGAQLGLKGEKGFSSRLRFPAKNSQHGSFLL